MDEKYDPSSDYRAFMEEWRSRIHWSNSKMAKWIEENVTDPYTRFEIAYNVGRTSMAREIGEDLIHRCVFESEELRKTGKGG
jgi:hypothetical protein